MHRPSTCGCHRARRGSSRSTSAAAACPRRGRSSPSRRVRPQGVLQKVLQSAVSNAEANHGIAEDRLYVKATYVDGGPVMKRWRARARGRVARIRKRTCHITVTLVEAPAVAAPVVEEAAPAEVAEAPKPKRAAAKKTTAAARRRRPRPSVPRRRRRPQSNGPKSSSRRDARRRHPRLEVQLVHGQEGVPRRT